ncbi:MAG: SGNH/GDSL hydrolase family protein [Aggregatilineales bacterium]
MTKRWTAVLWTALVLLAIIAGWSAGVGLPEHTGVTPALALMIVVTTADSLSPRWRQRFALPVRWLRRRPILYWLVLLATLSSGLGLWIVNFQPTNGRPLEAVEYLILLTLAWVLVYLLFYDLHTDQLRAIGAELGQSQLAGAMVTLTTVVFIFFAAEAYLRLFYITTDGYGFTAMNYHWYKNFYWGHYNSLGYRDAEPLPADADVIRVAVVGDSFAMGHGINNLEDTFARRLGHALGPGYDVNVIAHSGWDTDVQLYHLDSYPLRPNVVILSYYLNDIDHLLQTPELNPDNRFAFPDDPTLSWFILNFFAPNYVYYNLLQFTSTERTSNHLQDLVNAHLNDNFWQRQAQLLFEIVSWTRDHNARLIALLWPHITAIDESQPAVQRVRAFFEEAGVPVVDMSDALRGHDPRQLVVNRFDSHPGVEAHRLAAAALYPIVAHADNDS